MRPGHHLRLALVSLFFLLGKYDAAPPPIARSMKYINEDKNPTEELKNLENSHNVYPSSHHHSVPVNTDYFTKWTCIKFGQPLPRLQWYATFKKS
ncbi:hypothetical protein AOLI_G00108140 [Acnodon oligacanthus]